MTVTDSPVSAYDAAATAMLRGLFQRPGCSWDSLDEHQQHIARADIRAALDALLAAREHTTCPTCGGRGGGPEWPQDDSWCRSCDGSGSVPGGSLLLAVMVEKGLGEEMIAALVEAGYLADADALRVDPKLATERWCDSVLLRGHEAFGCLEQIPAHRLGHAGPHRGGVYQLEHPCPSCGALDLHSPECPTPDLMELPGEPLSELTWTDGDEGVVRDPSHMGVTYNKNDWEFRDGEYRRRVVAGEGTP